MAASTVTHASSLEITVAEGSIHMLVRLRGEGQDQGDAKRGANELVLHRHGSGLRIEIEVYLAEFFACRFADRCTGAFAGHSKGMRWASRPPTSRAASTTSS